MKISYEQTTTMVQDTARSFYARALDRYPDTDFWMADLCDQTRPTSCEARAFAVLLALKLVKAAGHKSGRNRFRVGLVIDPKTCLTEAKRGSKEWAGIKSYTVPMGVIRSAQAIEDLSKFAECGVINY